MRFGEVVRAVLEVTDAGGTDRLRPRATDRQHGLERADLGGQDAHLELGGHGENGADDKLTGEDEAGDERKHGTKRATCLRHPRHREAPRSKFVKAQNALVL